MANEMTPKEIIAGLLEFVEEWCFDSQASPSYDCHGCGAKRDSGDPEKHKRGCKLKRLIEEAERFVRNV